MEQQCDFTISNLKQKSKIARPQLSSVSVTGKLVAKQSERQTYEIQKSFTPQSLPLMNQAMRNELQGLKHLLKRKIKNEKLMKEKILSGEIKIQNKQKDNNNNNNINNNNNEQIIKIDQSGHARDQKGNLIYIKNRMIELEINKKQNQQIQLKQLNKKRKIKFHKKLSKSLMDRNLFVGSVKKRIRRSILGLQFLEKGSYQSIPKCTNTNTTTKLEQKQQFTNIQEKEKQIQLDNKIIKKRNKINLQYLKQIPQIQWWDKQLLKLQNYQEIILQLNININNNNNNNLKQQLNKNIQQQELIKYINLQKINNKIYYQKVQINNNKKQDRTIMPNYLTKNQKKKLKRKRKRQSLEEKNDKIKLGLIKPDKPKIKIANMAIVMKNQFIIDPSKIQSEVRKQTQERLNQHLERNSNRKLSTAKKKEKVLRKLKRDSAKELRRVVFRIQKLIEPTQIFKVNTNATQLALNGFVIKPNSYHMQPVLVVAEGGSKAIRFYKNLMLNRIRWKEKDTNNGCILLWQGQVNATGLGKWHVYEVGDESETIRILIQKKLSAFQDFLYN